MVDAGPWCTRPQYIIGVLIVDHAVLFSVPWVAQAEANTITGLFLDETHRPRKSDVKPPRKTSNPLALRVVVQQVAVGI